MAKLNSDEKARLYELERAEHIRQEKRKNSLMTFAAFGGIGLLWWLTEALGMNI